jgi:Copper transport outer membrane protein, MctB
LFGFDFRYHALSLIAVLIALAVGLLLGVAIGDKGLVSSAETNLRQSLRGQVHHYQQQVSTLKSELNDATDVQQQLYSVAVGGQLSDKRIGVIGLGSLPNSIVQNTIDALKESGGRVSSQSEIGFPLNLGKLGAKAKGTRYATLGIDPGLVQAFAKRIAIQIADGRGGLLRQVQGTLLTNDSNGQLDGVSGIVLYRADPPKLSDADAATVKAFDDGLIAGFVARGVPVVGVQQSDTDPSQIDWYKHYDALSTVDDIDEITGKISLVYALGGLLHGNYGTRSGGPAVPHTLLGTQTTTTDGTP